MSRRKRQLVPPRKEKLDASASGRGGVSLRSGGQVSIQESTEHKDVGDGMPDNVAKASLVLRADVSLSAQECRMGVASFKQLMLSGGCIVCVRSVHAVAYLEVCLSPVLAGDSISVSDDTFALLLDPQVSVMPIRSSALPQLWCAELRVSLDEAHSSVSDACADAFAASSELQWCALFRSAFHNRVIFHGMRGVLRFSATRVRFEVVQLQQCSCSLSCHEKTFSVPYGMLTDRCKLSACTFGNASANLEQEQLCDVYVGTKDVAASCPLCVLSSQSYCFFREHVHQESHVLLIGDSGVGKSYLLQQLIECTASQSPHCTVLTIHAEELPPREDGGIATGTALREFFRQAHMCAPSIIIIDDLHLLCGGDESSGDMDGGGGMGALGSRWAMSMMARALCSELDRIDALHASVRVWASALSTDSLDASLLIFSRLGGSRVVHIPALAHPSERVQCLRQCIRAVLPRASPVEESVLRDVAAHTHGFTQRDLKRLVERSLAEGFRCSGRIALDAHVLQRVARATQPSSLQHIDACIPNTTWNDIGGSAHAKQILTEVVEWCLGKHGWIFNTFHLTPPKGVLLFGPPGCSKTMLAKALAHESGMNFISVKGPEVFSKWVGDSEKAVRNIFARARASAPCVVFIDELDGMCGHRGQGGVSDRVISQFLTELDGLPAVFADQSNALVFVAATNRPDNIDSAILRPGRIDRKVYVGLPDRGERAAIARIHLAYMPTAEGVSADHVAQRTDGYTGAEVVAVVKEAAFIAITEDVDAKYITQSHIDAALVKVRPRVSAADVAWYATWPQCSSMGKD